MPFASQSRDFMRVWSALVEGDDETAEAVIEERILPVSRLGFQGRDLFYHVHKSILRRDGIFRTAVVRPPTAQPDATTMKELDRLLARLRPPPDKTGKTVA